LPAVSSAFSLSAGSDQNFLSRSSPRQLASLAARRHLGRRDVEVFESVLFALEQPKLAAFQIAQRIGLST